ncbi:hypothetical protein LWS67_09935 [Bacillus atrophaeus]|nr:hypothetical protein [Bacillus atrophaeus]
MIIHHIKVSPDVFDALLTKVSEIQVAENVGSAINCSFVNQTVIKQIVT